ncbi:T9SS type A sorting domain-containing protein [bacterium]|nr:T9SS type A sorting domain-containing protein [bacterium]
MTMESGHNVTGIDFTLGTGAAVQGQVTDAENGQPIAGAAIEVQSVHGRVRTRGLTDEEGRYLISGLPPGAYLVSAAVAGYHLQWYDSVAVRREAKQILLASSQVADDINFKLGKIEPLSVSLSGLVIDDSTKLPLPGAHILAMPVSSRGRIRRAITGEDGVYVLRGLPPAKYLLLIHAARYKAEFYDDARTWKEAKLIEVVAGQEITGIDIGLSPQPVGAYQLTGRVLDQSGSAIEGALIVLQSGEEVVAASVTAEDGSYNVEDLPADSYVVSASVVGYESAPTLSTALKLGSTLNVYGLTLMTLAGTTEAAKPIVQPERFALEQNHPNPFNPSTQIPFTLAQPGMVVLTVYDMLGREVKQLVNGSLAAGKHSVQWDGSNERGEKAASGVYFYRLQAFGHTHSFTQLRRMLLIK